MVSTNTRVSLATAATARVTVTTSFDALSCQRVCANKSYFLCRGKSVFDCCAEGAHLAGQRVLYCHTAIFVSTTLESAVAAASTDDTSIYTRIVVLVYLARQTCILLPTRQNKRKQQQQQQQQHTHTHKTTTTTTTEFVAKTF